MSASISIHTEFDNIDVKTFITRIKKRQKSVFVKQMKKAKTINKTQHAALWSRFN